VQHLRSQATAFASCIASSSLNWEAVYWAFWQYYRPKVSFSIPVLSLTPSQCTHIQAPALQTTLSELHLNRHWPFQTYTLHKASTSYASFWGTYDYGIKQQTLS
jgi:hypothetical protein